MGTGRRGAGTGRGGVGEGEGHSSGRGYRCRMVPGRDLLAALLGALLLAAAACRPAQEPRRRAAAPSTPRGEQRQVYVAVGASESVGVGAERPLEQAWPAVFHRLANPPGTVFVNLGISGATVAEALRQELPQALAQRATLVTVWLNVNDLLSGVPPDRYEERLGELVHALRRGGATTVLVANTPRLDVLPAYRACRPDSPTPGSCPAPGAPGWTPSPAVLNGLVQEYNAAIGRVVRREGAVLVDLHAASSSAAETGTTASFVSGDGFHPSTAGHRAVAELFADALRRADGTGG